MLYVHHNDHTAIVIDDLSLIADDPALQVDLWNAAGPGTGEVYFLGEPMLTPGSNLIQALIASPTHVAVRGELPDFSLAPAADWLLRDKGGAVSWDGEAGVPSVVDIVYDVTNCDGRMYWADGGGGSRVDIPRHVALFHELTHAFELASGLFDSSDQETFAIDAENDYREYLGLPPRASSEGGCVAPADSEPGTENPFDAWRLPGALGTCFVATAALGRDAPQVRELRRIRDEIILGTTWGRTEFAYFYQAYAHVSPVIVAVLERDPRLKTLVAQGVVQPLMLLARLFRDFPDEPIPPLGDPWSSFLSGLRTELEALTAFIELPTAFPNRSATERAFELAILLQFVLRTETSRTRYLDALRRDGAVPVRLGAGAAERVASQLIASGVRPRIIEQVVESI
jgi:hypothetical protein